MTARPARIVVGLATLHMQRGARIALLCVFCGLTLLLRQVGTSSAALSSIYRVARILVFLGSAALHGAPLLSDAPRSHIFIARPRNGTRGRYWCCASTRGTLGEGLPGSNERVQETRTKCYVGIVPASTMTSSHFTKDMNATFKYIVVSNPIVNN